MTYCPKCGTDNRRGSRFCNECGEPLPMGTALRCPMCGTMNPIGNVYCDRCNARLTPMTVAPPEEAEREQAPIKGLSLPTIPLEEEKERQVGGVTKRGEVEEEIEEDVVEDWLARLRSSDEEEEGQEEKEEDLEGIAESIEPVEFPDWLRDMSPISVETGATLDEEQPAIAEPLDEQVSTMPLPASADMPDWLQEITSAEMAAPEDASPVAEIMPEEPASEMPAQVPDWLQEIAPAEMAAPEGAPPVAEAVPEELGPVPETPAPAEIPDWLQEAAPAEVAIPEGAPPVAEAVPEELGPVPETPAPAEIPDWLQEIASAEVAVPEGAPPVAEDVPEELGPVPETPAPAEIPDWLQEAAPAEVAIPEGAPPVAEAVPEELGPVPETPAPAEIPDWLQEIAPAEVAVPEGAPPVAEAVPEELGPVPETPAPAEIPDWLQEIAPAEVAAPEGAPPVAEAVPEELGPVPETPAPAETPDWLQEIAPAEVAAPEGALPVAEVVPEELGPVPETPAPAEIPDWLQEAAPAEAVAPKVTLPASSPFVGAPPPAEAEVPEWLREIAPEEEVTPGAISSAPSLVEFPMEAETAGGPDWLPEAQAETALSSTPVTPVFEGVTLPPPAEPGIRVAEEEGLARAEIPDWLEALRPRPEAIEVVIEEEQVEIEGPLQGLRGVLPVATAIEVSPVRESTLPAEISEAGLARAQLLQSLLARPAEMPQPEVRRRGISLGERLQRWLVTAVLLVAVGGVLIPPLAGFDVPTLTQPTTSNTANGRIEFQHFMNLYNAVQSTSAGDTVLVAFEYGPSEADELDLVAEPILQHLLDQGAHISVVSTRPEGLAVAAGVLSDIVSSEEQYTLVGYRPGDTTGVSQLLTDFDILSGEETEGGTRHKLILVLTAQPGPLRWWIEQARVLSDTPPVVAGVSTALGPAACPYLDASAGQLEGAVSGLSGAATYEAHRGLKGRATQLVNALAAGHAAVVGLTVIGAVVYAFGGARGRKK
ncbi:MAG: zinc ribbon domain-containing protein [Chloroflexota bacterium]|nr:zinc ribbon domain-containing protein [Chloroflexota bacterium]